MRKTVGLVLAMLALASRAEAGSRIVVTTSEPVQLFFDGALVPSSVGTMRSAIPHVEPGKHLLAIHDLGGQRLHAEELTVADGADIRIRWSKGSSFVVSGAESSGTVDSSAGAALPSESAPPAVPPPASTPSSSGSEPLRSTSVRAPSVGQVTGLVTGSGVAGLAAGAAVSGVQALTYGAKAGTKFKGPSAAPQRIVKPNVVYGHVRLIKESGGPLLVYEEGMVVAQLAEGATELDVQLEVGRRTIEVRSGLDNRILFTGDLTVDSNYRVQVALSESAAPTALERPWLFKPY